MKTRTFQGRSFKCHETQTLVNVVALYYSLSIFRYCVRLCSIPWGNIELWHENIKDVRRIIWYEWSGLDWVNSPKLSLNPNKVSSAGHREVIVIDNMFWLYFRHMHFTWIHYLQLSYFDQDELMYFSKLILSMWIRHITSITCVPEVMSSCPGGFFLYTKFEVFLSSDSLFISMYT